MKPFSPLIKPSKLSRIGFIIFGFNLALFLNYIFLFWKRDKKVTKILLSLVLLFNFGSAVIEVFLS